jgi:hypothetical protein
MERRIRPWINKKIIEYIGEPEPTLVDFICSKVLAGSAPQGILDDVQMVSCYDNTFSSLQEQCTTKVQKHTVLIQESMMQRYINMIIHYGYSLGSLVSIVTSYRPDQQGIWVQFLAGTSTAFRLALDPIQCLPALFPGG